MRPTGMNMLLKAALVFLALSLLFLGLSFVGRDGGSDTSIIGGVIAYVLMWVCGGMVLFLGLIAIVVRALDSFRPPRDDERFPHSSE
jgi:hypothetical protein